jgi:hypothetical protein
MTRIRDIKVLEIFATLNYDGDFWEERLIRPIDIHPEHDIEGSSVMAEGYALDK